MIQISVRNLVEFILRSGNLDNRRSFAADKEAMLKGSKIHRKIQKQMKASYRAEVPLQWNQEYDEFIIRVEGRADGIIEEEGPLTELKCHYNGTKSMMNLSFVWKEGRMES